MPPTHWSCWSNWTPPARAVCGRRGERLRIVARADSSKLRLQIKTAEDWLQASGELRIDPQRTVDLKQLFAMLDASSGSRFLALGAGEFVALTESFRRQLEDLHVVSRPAAGGAVRVAPVAALALEELIDQAQLDADRQWRGLKRRLREAREFEPVVPGTLQAELRPYQEEGFGWLARLSRWGAGACLADDMGLGKTVQVLALLLERAGRRAGAGGGAHLRGGELARRGTPLRADAERGALRGAGPGGPARP